MSAPFSSVVTVTLNPAIDCIYDVPWLTLGAHQSGRMRQRTPAGKGINVARTLALMGQPCTVAGFMGASETSLYEESLAAHHIRTCFVTIDAPTRANITLIDPESKTETHIRDRGFEVSADDLARMSDLLASLAGERVLVVFCGSLPRGMEAQDLADMVDLCCARGSLAAIDAEGAILRALGDRPLWAIKPNRREFQQLVGRSLSSLRDVAKHARAVGDHVQEVLVSCGEDGALLLANDCVWRGQAGSSRMKLVSTVGCGDALLAGYILGRLRGGEPTDALRMALATATSAAHYAVPGEVDREQAEGMLADVQVRVLTDS